MPVLGLNTNALIYHIASTNRSGDIAYGPPVATKIAMLQQKSFVQLSPVRSEASASHGRTEEDMGNVTALFLPLCGVLLNDRIDTLGQSLEVINIFPREDGYGGLSHLEVTLKFLDTDTTATYTPSLPSI